uniref:Putative grp-2 478 glycine rich family n=1 Tax=Ixodes ricinus TaxID=34613 RepID=V5HNG7_IXORI
MGLAKTTLVLGVPGLSSQALRPAIAKNGTRPASEENREGCDYYCWNAETKSWDKFFFGNGERCFYNNGDEGLCQNGECHLTTDSGVPNDSEF